MYWINKNNIKKSIIFNTYIILVWYSIWLSSSTALLDKLAADEHVSVVERSVCPIKDSSCCRVQYLPYTKYTRTIVIGCVIYRTRSLNNEIGISKLSNEHSPNSLIID